MKDVADLDQPSEATHKTVLAFPLQILLSFLGSRNQSVDTQASLLPTHFKTKWMQALCASVQFSLVAQSYPTFCDPMNCNTQGLSVHHQLPGFTQIHFR